ncbi:MAG: ABC transporter ATP-binding protein [Hyphomicrobiales bacterium]|jgi:putative hydroxymethylpyrimidine transport system ATP-binding protein|nr:ABC transporter ATP-binding protein [Hyphomicrobiales bacterium]|tara:strand:- start:1903 stop:2628 length:726 start_codon:yes stop_codon:yes gene_type:complete
MKSTIPSLCINGHALFEDNILFNAKNMIIGSSQWTCLLGPSGSGKSTLLRLIAGLDTHVVFNGDIKASDNNMFNNRVAYMAQSDLLLPWLNVIDNIKVGSKLRGDKIDNNILDVIIENVGLVDHRQKYPSELSGGQRQRVALARTLMENKPIILLDEPFSALDAKTRLEMQDLVVMHLQDKTILLVTHDPSEATRLCHNIYLLNDNEIYSTKSLPPPFPKSINDRDAFSLQTQLLEEIRST